MQVLDYSAGFPGAQAIAEAGYGGAVRYIGFPNNPKCTTAEELDDFTRHGLGMALVYEYTAGDWRAGHPGGVEAARRARAHADAIGFPADRPIYFAVDQDVVYASEFDLMSDYLRGACDVLGVENVGVYGEYDVCVRASNDGVASYIWQCRAWSGSPVRLFDGRTLYQHYGDGTGGPNPVIGGVECDINDVLVESDWGQHLLEGDDMATVPQHEWGFVRDAVADMAEGKAGARTPGSQFLGELAFREGATKALNALGTAVAEIATKTPGVKFDEEQFAVLRGDLQTQIDELQAAMEARDEEQFEALKAMLAAEFDLAEDAVDIALRRFFQRAVSKPNEGLAV